MTQTAFVSAEPAPTSLIEIQAGAAFDAMHLAFPSLSLPEIALAIHRLLQAGYAIVPIHPQADVLSSMLRRHQSEAGTHPDIGLMAKLHEEVVGLGAFNCITQDLQAPSGAEHDAPPVSASPH